MSTPLSNEILKSKYGTLLTADEIRYRQKLIEECVVCFVTGDFLNEFNGEILYANGQDFFISNEGIEKLMTLFDEDYIKQRIITYD